MTDQRADAAITAHVEAAQRFDYFVTGGAGTVLAYAVQSYDPFRPLAWPYVAVLSWAFLLISVGLGLLHLSVTVESMRLTPISLDLGAMADTLREAQHKGVGVFLGGAGLAATNPIQIQQALDMCEREVQKVTGELQKSGQRRKWYARGRNAALFAGLFTLAVWKAGNL